MKSLTCLWTRMRDFAMGRHSNHRLRDEIEVRLASQAEQNMGAGGERAEARRRAVLTFGVVESVRESYRAEQRLPRGKPYCRNAAWLVDLVERIGGAGRDRTGA